MPDIIEIKTQRLLLRQWRLTDFNLFAEINSSKTVMKYFPNTLSRSQSDEFATNIQQQISEKGWGFWAVEIPSVCEFIGFVGLNKPVYQLPFSPCIEIGWRLSEKYWSQGFATEAAQAALVIAFKQLALTEVVAFTSRLNTPSEKVMQRLNMQNTKTTFEHPKVPYGHILREHLLYKITCSVWQTQNSV